MSLHRQRGNLLFNHGRYDKAAAEFRLALAEDPDDWESHVWLGLSLSNQGRPREGELSCRKAIGISPESAFGHYGLADCLLDQGLLKDALEAAREGLRLMPDNPAYHHMLARCQFERRDWHETVRITEQALELDPLHRGATRLRALALINLGRVSEAGDDIDRVLAYDPEDAGLHAARGRASLHEGDAATATEHFREALRLDPEFGDPHYGLLEAFKARHSAYRVVLRYLQWLERLPLQRQVVILLALLLTIPICFGVGFVFPGINAVAQPMAILVALFLYVSLTALSWTDVFLCLHPKTRRLLPPDRMLAAVGLLLCLGLCGFGTILNRWAVSSWSPGAEWASVGTGIVCLGFAWSLPIAGFVASDGAERTVLTWATFLFPFTSLRLLAPPYLGDTWPDAIETAGNVLIVCSIFFAVATVWTRMLLKAMKAQQDFHS